jgi:O-antigen/teichoic acid export membrane protein
MITRHSVQAAGYLAINRLAVPLVGLALLIVIGRVSGRLLGEYALVMSFYLVMQTVPLLGLTPFVMREVARAPEQAGRWFGTIAPVALCGCALVDAIVLPLLPWLGYGPEVRAAVSLVGVSIAPGILAYLAEILLVSLNRARPVAIVPLVENAVRLLASAAVLWMGGGAVALTIVLLIGRVAAFLAYVVLLRRQPGFQPRFDGAIWRRTRAVLPTFLISGVLTVVVGRLDFIVLSVAATLEEVGHYSTFEIATVASAAALTGLFPILAQRFHAGSTDYLAQILGLLPALLSLALPIALLGYVLSPAYVRVLFPKQYPAPVTLAGEFCLLAVLGWTDQFFAAALNAADRQRTDTAAFAAGSAAFVVALLLLVPRLGGDGAFVAMLVGVCVQSTLRLIALSAAGAPIPVGDLARWLALGLPLTLGVVFLRPSHPLLAAATTIAAALVLAPRALERLGLAGAAGALPRFGAAMADWIRR